MGWGFRVSGWDVFRLEMGFFRLLFLLERKSVGLDLLGCPEAVFGALGGPVAYKNDYRQAN